jgi:hypothetical protein
MNVVNLVLTSSAITLRWPRFWLFRATAKFARGESGMNQLFIHMQSTHCVEWSKRMLYRSNSWSERVWVGMISLIVSLQKKFWNFIFAFSPFLASAMPYTNRILCKDCISGKFGAIQCWICKLVVLEECSPDCRGMFWVIQLQSIIHISWRLLQSWNTITVRNWWHLVEVMSRTNNY